MDAVQGVVAQKTKTKQIVRRVFEQQQRFKCAIDDSFAGVSIKGGVPTFRMPEMDFDGF